MGDQASNDDIEVADNPPDAGEPPAPAAEPEAPAEPEAAVEPAEGAEPAAAEGEPGAEGEQPPVAEGEQPPEAEGDNNEPAPPEKEPDPYEVFQPKLYNFELYNYDKLKMMLFRNTRPDNLEIRCPEFSTLLDHSIALLWLFYNDNKNWNNFTVPHIEWALKFISGIASEAGQNFIDMETIKKHLETLLFETYSETDTAVLDEKPPIDDYGILGPTCCPNCSKKCTPIPESLKGLLSRAPDMVVHLSITTGNESENAAQEELELNRANMMQSAYLKLNSFEKKHLTRITEEIELFEMIKALKHELGYNNGSVDANEITTLRLRVEELEKKLLDQADLR